MLLASSVPHPAPHGPLLGSAGWCLPRSHRQGALLFGSSSPAQRAETLSCSAGALQGGLRRPVPRSPAVSGEAVLLFQLVDAAHHGRRELSPGKQALRRSPAGCSSGAADAAGSSFTLWLGADGCAAQTQQCSPPQRMQSHFSAVSVLFFLRSLFGAVAASVSALPQRSRRLHRQARRLGRQQGCGAQTAHRDGKSHHRRGHHLARRTARLLFWCSCIFRSHSALLCLQRLYSNAASLPPKVASKCRLQSIPVYTQPQLRQCPSVSPCGALRGESFPP